MEKLVYQLMDERCRYRSRVVLLGKEEHFISVERKRACVYTWEEAKVLAKYYIEEKNIPVMIECRTITDRQQI